MFINRITIEKDLLDYRLFSPQYAAIELPHEKKNLLDLDRQQENKKKTAEIALMIILIRYLSRAIISYIMSPITTAFSRFSPRLYTAFLGVVLLGRVLLLLVVLYCVYLIWDWFRNSDEPLARKLAMRGSSYPLSIQKDIIRKKIRILENIIEKYEADLAAEEEAEVHASDDQTQNSE